MGNRKLDANWKTRNVRSRLSDLLAEMQADIAHRRISATVSAVTLGIILKMRMIQQSYGEIRFVR